MNSRALAVSTWTRRRRRWLLGLAVLVTPILLAPLALRLVPLPPALFEPPPAAIELTDRDGRPLRELSATDLVTRGAALEAMPQSLLDATLAAEDRRFWEHHGVDWLATGRAAWQLARHQRVISGGSTLTQQLIKLAEPRPRTVWTKLVEALQALRLEQVWTKPQILEAYLRRLDYGNLRRGAASASAFYFGRAPADLSVAEAALLAGLPQAPSRLNPYRHFDRAKRRQEWILERMTAVGWLDPAQAARARTLPLRLRPGRRDFAAPHFVDLVLQLEREGLANHPGGRLATTLDLGLERRVERILREHLAGLGDRHVRHGAVVVLHVPTGDVLALVGSGDYSGVDGGQVNGAWAPRSAGSTFKPFTYLLALEAGATPATVIADVPVEFPTPTGLYAPRNYDGRCHGPVRLRDALANSLNIPAVRTLQELGGAPVLLDRLRACGLMTLDQPADFYGLGLTVGNAEARLLELANAYAGLARLGEYQPFRLIADSGTSPARGGGGENGGAAGNSPPRTRRVFDADTTWLLADMLRDDTARALAFGLDSPLRFDFPVACKTGTSTAFRDNWAFGYTPEFVVGVWMGNFDGEPMIGVSGVTGAAPVMHEVLVHLHERFGTSWYATPPAIVERPVHRVTGRLVAADRPDAVREKFLALPEPERPEDYDAAGRVRLPPEYAAWLAEGGDGLARSLVVGSDFSPSRAGAPPRSATIRLQQPLPASVYVLDPDLPDAGGWLPLRAQGTGELTWTSATLAIAIRDGRPCARLSEGRHELEARDPATGAVVRTWIEVRRL